METSIRRKLSDQIIRRKTLGAKYIEESVGEDQELNQLLDSLELIAKRRDQKNEEKKSKTSSAPSSRVHWSKATVPKPSTTDTDPTPKEVNESKEGNEWQPWKPEDIPEFSALLIEMLNE